MNDATGAAPVVAVHHAARSGLIHDARLDAEAAARLFVASGHEHAGRGRGAIRVVEEATGRVVIRHYRRGGAIARLSRDWFVWTGAEHTRPFREFRITHRLHACGLPVPEVVAARYQRHGAGYRADLATREVPAARTLAERLASGVGIDWEALGQVIARFHARGLWHADLNAHNVLYDGEGRALLIDFDRARMLTPHAPRLRDNLERLARSLRKLGHAGRVDGPEWHALSVGYADQTRSSGRSR